MISTVRKREVEKPENPSTQEASLVYKVSSRRARVTQRNPVLGGGGW